MFVLSNSFLQLGCDTSYQRRAVPSLVFEKRHHILDSLFLNTILNISRDCSISCCKNNSTNVYLVTLSRRFFVSSSTIFSEFSLLFASFFIKKRSFLSYLRFSSPFLQKFSITSKLFFVVLLS